MKLRLLLAVGCLCIPCWAQSPVGAPPATAASAATGPAEPKVQRTHIEDGQVRIDELRVRGLNRRVVVQSKLAGAPAYEIGTDNDARDSSQDWRGEGRSSWRLFSF